MKKEDWSVFYLLDRNNDIVETVIGYKKLVSLTYSSVKSGEIKDSFKSYRIEDIPFWVNRLRTKADYVIVDENFHIVPVLEILKDYVPRYSWVKSNGNFTYREDPVPGTGRRRWHWTYEKAARRKQQFYQQFRDSQDPEHKGLIRPSRRFGAFNPIERRWDSELRGNLYNAYSWKKNKKRKQWM